MTLSAAAVRCAMASTLALLLAVAVGGSLRPVFAFIWIVLCLCAMGLEVSHRRLTGQPIRRRPRGRRHPPDRPAKKR